MDTNIWTKQMKMHTQNIYINKCLYIYSNIYLQKKNLIPPVNTEGLSFREIWVFKVNLVRPLKNM